LFGGAPASPPPSLFAPPAPPPPAAADPKLADNEVSITEMMKNPSKAVLLKVRKFTPLFAQFKAFIFYQNMVGPGEVDEDLEPEVKDECNTKYGDVVKVMIREVPNVIPEETVQIYVEFKRIESAIKGNIP